MKGGGILRRALSLSFGKLWRNLDLLIPSCCNVSEIKNFLGSCRTTINFVATLRSGFCSLFNISNYSHTFQNSFIVILFIVEPLRGSEYTLLSFFCGFHPELLIFYPFGVITFYSLNPIYNCIDSLT